MTSKASPEGSSPAHGTPAGVRRDQPWVSLGALNQLTSLRMANSSFLARAPGDEVIATEGPTGGGFKHPAEYPQGVHRSRNASNPFEEFKTPLIGP